MRAHVNNDPVYLRMSGKDALDFLRYVRDCGARKTEGERPPQTDVPDDGIPDNECRGQLSGVSGRFGDPVIPVRRPEVRAPRVPTHRVPEEPLSLRRGAGGRR